MFKRFTIFLFIFVYLFFGAVQTHAQSPEEPTVVQDTFYKAKVTEVTREYARDDDFGPTLYAQDIVVEIKNGDRKGDTVDVTNEYATKNGERELSVGDTVILGEANIAGETSLYISDVYRLHAALIVLIIFVLCTLIFARKHGIRAFVGLLFSFLVIFYFMIPQIISGTNPFWVAVVTALCISVFALFIAHGFNLRTTISFISTTFTIVLTIIASQVYVGFSRLSGLGSEEAFFLQFTGTETIDLRGLLLAGIIIGTLGVLDDSTTAQAAAVEEIYKANKKIDAKQLYAKGMSVGREHIVSLVNTLVLAYTGVSLPLMLLFTIYPQPLWVTLNSEIIMEEVIRMLIGSSALVIAVPLTTLCAVWFLVGGGKKILQKYPNNIFFRSGGPHYH